MSWSDMTIIASAMSPAGIVLNLEYTSRNKIFISASARLFQTVSLL
jgi:hypothetical protein